MRLLWLAILLLNAPAAMATPLSTADREAVIESTATLIEQRYVDAARGKQIARKIRAGRNRWEAADNAERFAEGMTAWLRELSGDGHFQLTYSAETLTDEAIGETFNEQEMLRFYGPQLNHGIEKIERLANNIIVLDIRSFPPNEMAGDVYAGAMSVVAQGDALIIDLRKNGGGADTINLITGYLLPPGSPLSGSYNRPKNETVAQVSPSWVPGRRFGNTKPLYILTAKRTFSAAEALAYDLQALKRAVIVGEVTGGGANPFEYRRVHPHFAVSLPEMRSINPITGTNWQNVGVKPDVAVPADRALETAISLARAAIKTRAASGSDRQPGKNMGKP